MNKNEKIFIEEKKRLNTLKKMYSGVNECSRGEINSPKPLSMADFLINASKKINKKVDVRALNKLLIKLKKYEKKCRNKGNKTC